MPNDCWSHITITASKSDLNKLLETEFVDAPEHGFNIRHRGLEGVILNLLSAWSPDFVWLESLLTKYPTCWVKNEWKEEGGQAGVWIGTQRHGDLKIDRFDWDDMCIEEDAHRFRTE